MRKLLFGLLGMAGQVLAATGGSINPICSVVQALAENADIIIWLVIGILGVIIMAVGVVELAAGKAHRTLVVILGGAVILIATYRMLSTGKETLQRLANNCGGSASLELVWKPEKTLP